MGKHFWMRHLNESNSNKQPGCMWGLAHVLDYHHWHSNVRKMIQLRKYEDKRDWSPESKMYSPEDDVDETENLLAENESPFLSNKRSRATKKTHVKARKKALSGEGKCLKPSLQRSYSIHHLKSLDDDDEKSRTNRKVDPDDVLEIFKIDKELLVKRLQEAGISKSTSFPAVSERIKFKAVKLESRHKEIRLFPVENRIEKARSLNESADKYAQLFENIFPTDIAKLSVSKSLKLTNEYGHPQQAPVCFRRIRSLSNVDSCYINSNQEFEVLADIGLRNSEEQNVALDDQSMQIHEEDDGFVSDSRSLDHQVSEGFDIHCAVKLEKNNETSDLHYVRHLLDRSGIAVDPCGMTWHASDQPLGPQLFEEVESCWPHGQDQIKNDAWPDYWHHRMLFDLVNEVLAEVYDLSLPYYPKPLSSSCRVSPFTGGDHFVEGVCTSIGAFLLGLEPHDEKQSLDDIVGRDLAHDRCWMNLQLETESLALYFEDVIFDELLEEVFFS